MAFEKLNDYTNKLRSEYEKANKRSMDTSDGIKSALADHTASTVFSCMMDYYNTVLQIPKFKSQKALMKQTIIEINPHFAKGFFK